MTDSTYSKKISVLVVLAFLLIILLVVMIFRARIRQIDRELEQQHRTVR